MKRSIAASVAMATIVLLFSSTGAQERRRPAVFDRHGRPVKAVEAVDQVKATLHPEGGAVSTEAFGPPLDCPPPGGTPDVRLRESRRGGKVVDACGRVTRDAGMESRLRPALPSSPALTIDRMTTRGSYYTETYTPGGTLLLLGSADTYFLSDGSSWESGAGSYNLHSARLDRVEVVGATIRYVLLPPPAGLVYQQTDFDSGDHSAQGSLGVAGPLVIEATAGSATATMHGLALIASNDATWYGEPRFNFYTSIVGSVVPFQQTYTLQGQTWAPDTFTRSFTYLNRGVVDFANPVSVPRAVELTIRGPARVPDESQIQFSAIVRYENDVRRNVTEASGWEVEPAELASIEDGLLSTARLATPQETLTLRAAYSERGASLTAAKPVVCLADTSLEDPGHWPMYQANARHTGHLPISLDADLFGLRWQRNVGGSFALNPVVAADGRVFVSLRTYFNDVPGLFALDAHDGQTLWSKNFGDVFSVNPPSYAYGTVYVQTGNHGTDTFLRAYDAATGDVVFQAPHAAQWERYYAPTIHDGKVYVNGGYYGGMYAFDAYAGTQSWFLGLPQYDEWTPAVAGGLAYAYVGSYTPGLYAADRLTGALVFVIDDPGFDWNGWSMNLAPVVGSHDDVIAIHDGRLISFDVAARTIRWQLDRQFTGQPSVAHDKIYAIDGGRLVVLDEPTGATQWSWQPPEGALQGPLIVTDTHLLASTAAAVYAVDLAERLSVWSYPAAGHLALGNGTLYVASANGTLTAIAMEEVVPSPLLRLEIIGLSQLVESSSASYTARAFYKDGRDRDRTLSSTWSVEPATYASLSPGGVMTTTEMLQPVQDVVVRAEYTEAGRTVQATRTVRLVIGVSLPEFVRRNLARSVDIKRPLVSELDSALVRERAALEVLLQFRPTPANRRRVALVREAILREEDARRKLLESIDLLKEAQSP